MLSSWLRRYLDAPVGSRLAVAFVLGGIAGWVVGPPVVVLRPLGDVFIRLLTVLVLPVVVCTIITGLGSVTPRVLSQVGVRSTLLYLGTSVGATTLGIAAALLTRPGVGMQLPGTAPRPPAPSLGSLLAGAVPTNVVAAMAEGQLLPVIVFTVPFALAIAALRQSDRSRDADTVHAFFDGCGRASFVLLRGVTQYAPVGTFALAAITFGQQSARVLTQFANVLFTLYLAQGVLCAGLLLLLAVSVPAGALVPGVRDVLVTAFVTGSSAATLPVELEAAEHRFRIDRGVLAFTLPLGLAINKVGSAVYFGVVSVFAANPAGVALVPAHLGAIFVLAWVGSVITPPVGSGALLVLGFVFSQAGLPVEAVGVIAAIPFAGRLNTPANSLGRLATTALVARATRPSPAPLRAGAWDAT